MRQRAIERRRKQLRRRGFLKAAPVALAAPALAQAPKPLRFVPQAGLASLDPVWTTAAATRVHANLVYDTLYGHDGASQIRPQMCAGHELSANERTWTFTLRDGLRFHDNTPVLAADCVRSIMRWASRNTFGQQLIAYVDTIDELDDRRFTIRLKRPCSQLLFGLGASNCFIMPERVASRPSSEELVDPTGSGPFEFVRDAWVQSLSGSYVRFNGYSPRQEQPAFFAGGKVANFARVEWIRSHADDVDADAAALVEGRVDWLEFPQTELLPRFNASPGTYTSLTDPGGSLLVLVLNNLFPPFSDPKVRQALQLALDHRAFARAVVGDQSQLAVFPTGLFTTTLPMANKAGIEHVTAPRDLTRARQMVAEAGYRGHPVLVMGPTDRPILLRASQAASDFLQSLGLDVKYEAMDWAGIVARRAIQTEDTEQGGWSAFVTNIDSMSAATPATLDPLHGRGRAGWYGWPEDETLEALRAAWFDATGADAQLAAAEAVQRRYFETVPFLLLFRLLSPMAFGADIKDVVHAPLPVFWGARRA